MHARTNTQLDASFSMLKCEFSESPSCVVLNSGSDRRTEEIKFTLLWQASSWSSQQRLTASTGSSNKINKIKSQSSRQRGGRPAVPSRPSASGPDWSVGVIVRLVAWWRCFREIPSTLPRSFWLPLTFFPLKAPLGARTLHKTPGLKQRYNIYHPLGLFLWWLLAFGIIVLRWHATTMRFPGGVSKFSIRNNCFFLLQHPHKLCPSTHNISGRRHMTRSRWMVKPSRGDAGCSAWLLSCYLMWTLHANAGGVTSLWRDVEANSGGWWEWRYLFILTSPGPE